LFFRVIGIVVTSDTILDVVAGQVEGKLAKDMLQILNK